MKHGDDTYLTTFGGRKFWPLDPRIEDIDINDIAHALSMQCRFLGHCRDFYSVAQHSVLMSHLIEPNGALYGLLHDAAETYIGDMTTGMKHDPEMAAFRHLDHRLTKLIYAKFGLSLIAEPADLKRVDLTLLRDEVRELGLMSRFNRGGFGIHIEPWLPWRAENEFHKRFQQLAPEGLVPTFEVQK